MGFNLIDILLGKKKLSGIKMGSYCEVSCSKCEWKDSIPANSLKKSHKAIIDGTYKCPKCGAIYNKGKFIQYL